MNSMPLKADVACDPASPPKKRERVMTRCTWSCERHELVFSFATVADPSLPREGLAGSVTDECSKMRRLGRFAEVGVRTANLAG